MQREWNNIVSEVQHHGWKAQIISTSIAQITRAKHSNNEHVYLHLLADNWKRLYTLHYQNPSVNKVLHINNSNSTATYRIMVTCIHHKLKLQSQSDSTGFCTKTV